MELEWFEGAVPGLNNFSLTRSSYDNSHMSGLIFKRIDKDLEVSNI